MLERRRHQYLSQLGIDSYVPRKILPAAPAPVLLSVEQIGSKAELLPPVKSIDVKEHNVHIDKGNQNEAEQQIGGDSTQAISSLLSSSPLSAEPNSVVETVRDEALQPSEHLVEHIDSAKPLSKSIPEEEQSKQSASSTGTELKFVLTVWRIKDQVLVIDSRQSGAAYPTDRLLQNILGAVGLPQAQLPKSEIIRWPLILNQQASSKTVEEQNQDVDEASAMVQAYISALLSKQAVKAMWLMGDDAISFALDTADQEGKNNQVIKSDDQHNLWKLPVITMPSLFSMLQDPALKAGAWAALKQCSFK